MFKKITSILLSLLLISSNSVFAQHSGTTAKAGTSPSSGGFPLTGVTTTGSPLSGYCSLFSSSTTITGNNGCTWSGTGSSFVATFGHGIVTGAGSVAAPSIGIGAVDTGPFILSSDYTGIMQSLSGSYAGALSHPTGLHFFSSQRIYWSATEDPARLAKRVAISSPSAGLLLVEDGSGNARDLQARTGTFGTSLIVGSEAALFNTYKGADSDGDNLFIGGGGQASIGAAGETYKGSNNTFLGIGAGLSNSTGYYNTFLGHGSGLGTTTGYRNLFVGWNAGYSNTAGAFNTFVGGLSGFANTVGASNTFIGQQAGYSNTTGAYNSFLGELAGYINSTGSSNTWIGRTAGYSATGSGNVGLGYSAGRYETGSNAFYLNNVDQTDTAGDKAYSLLYGTFAGSAGTTVGNTLTVNGALTATTSVTTPTLSFGTTVPGTLTANGSGYVLLTDNVSGAQNVVFGSGNIYPNSVNLQDLGVIGGEWRLGRFGTALLSPLLVSGPGKTGTNVAGGNNTIQAEPGTGSATGSSIVFQTPTATTSGTTAQAQTTRLTINEGSIVPAVPIVSGNYIYASNFRSYTGDNIDDIGQSGTRFKTGFFGTSVVTPVVQLTLATPTTSGDTCVAGTFWADANYLYVCTATNTIKRAALSAF